MGKKGLTFFDVMEAYKRKSTERLPTKILKLDIILNGGIPPGDFVELASDSGLGKSTITLQLAKLYAKNYGWVLIMDFEQGITDEILISTGCMPYVDSEQIRIVQPITYNDGERILDSIEGEANYPALVVVDSITAMLVDKSAVDSFATQTAARSPTAMEKTREKVSVTAGSGIGAKSRCEASFLLKYKGWCRQKNITMIFINQMRTHFTAKFKAYSDSAGGNAFKFYTDIRLYMRKTVDIMRKEKTISGIMDVPCGNTVEIVAKKNRGNRSFVGTDIDVIFGKGISNLKSMGDILIALGHITQSGSYFKVAFKAHEESVQGWAGLNKWISENALEIREFISESDTVSLTRMITE